jgi:hypothetical protein
MAPDSKPNDSVSARRGAIIQATQALLNNARQGLQRVPSPRNLQPLPLAWGTNLAGAQPRGLSRSHPRSDDHVHLAHLYRYYHPIALLADDRERANHQHRRAAYPSSSTPSTPDKCLFQLFLRLAVRLIHLHLRTIHDVSIRDRAINLDRIAPMHLFAPPSTHSIGQQCPLQSGLELWERQV